MLRPYLLAPKGRDEVALLAGSILQSLDKGLSADLYRDFVCGVRVPRLDDASARSSPTRLLITKRGLSTFWCIS